MKSANSAANTNTTMMTAPMAPSGYCRARWRSFDQRLSSLSAASHRHGVDFDASIGHAFLHGPSRNTDARVERRVEQIDEEVHEHDNDGDEHHQVLHDRVVAPADRLDQEARDAGNVEHGLGDDQAADQEGGLDADDGDHRQQRVAQGMIVVDVLSEAPLARAVRM